MIGAVVHDEETFVTTMSTSIGQPIGIVVAENEALAKEGARSVAVLHFYCHFHLCDDCLVYQFVL